MKFIQKNELMDGFNIITFFLIASVLLFFSCATKKDERSIEKYGEINGRFGSCVRRTDTDFYPLTWKWFIAGKNDYNYKYLIDTYEDVGFPSNVQQEWVDAKYLVRCEE